MEKLLEFAQRFMEQNPTINEVTLMDGCLSVHLVRVTPCPMYQTPAPYQPYVWQADMQK